MPQVQVNSNLTNQSFPFNFEEMAFTLLSGQTPDNTQRTDRDLPHAYYMENVLPIRGGYSSLALLEKIPANPSVVSVDQAFAIFGTEGRIAFFILSGDTAWIFDPNGPTWVETALAAGSVDVATFGTVREVTYIHLGIGLFFYDFDLQVLTEASVPALPGISNTKGVTAGGSQLVLWDESQLFISAVEDPLDFNPSIDTGATTFKINQLRGKITACMSLGRDFIVYSNINAVGALWTDNLSFPFRLIEIQGSAGVQTVKHIAFNTNTQAQIIWTPAGFQQVNVNQAQYIWPELSDAIIRGLGITRNTEFDIPELTRFIDLDLTVNFISNRYIAVSVGNLLNIKTEGYREAFVFDTSLGRWGRIVTPHRAFLEFTVPEVFEIFTYRDLKEQYPTYDLMEDGIRIYDTLTPDPVTEIRTGNSLGMILIDGSVQAIRLVESGNFSNTSMNSKIILGRYKLTQDSGVFTHWLKINKIFNGTLNFLGHSYTGEIVSKKAITTANLTEPNQYFQTFAADSVSLEISGDFRVTDVILNFSPTGALNQTKSTLVAVQ